MEVRPGSPTRWPTLASDEANQVIILEDEGDAQAFERFKTEHDAEERAVRRSGKGPRDGAAE